MSISFPTEYPEIDKLFAELSLLIRKHGKDSVEVDCFVEQHRDTTWVDKRGGETVFFEEAAKGMSILFEGLASTNEDQDPTEAADYWKTEDTFNDTNNTDDPANW